MGLSETKELVTPYLIDTMPQSEQGSKLVSLDPESIPRKIIGRDDEMRAVNQAFPVGDGHTENLYLFGPRGSGKTAVARNALRGLSNNVTTCYVSCTQHDTQYKILKEVYRALTGERLGQGYHTGQLQRRIEEQIVGREVVVVLDEIDFLLENDGNDLLYFLSRMNNTDNLTVVCISANHPVLSSVVEERTFSSLHPRNITFDAYNENQAYRILEQRLQNSGLTIERDALKYVTAKTTNTNLGLHWIGQAATAADGRISEENIRDNQDAAVERYRNALLDDFTVHHHIIIDAVSQLLTEPVDDTTSGTETEARGCVKAGLVYNRYHAICEERNVSVLTDRRLGDFITHLEVLGVIEVTHHPGGKHGRTREVRIRKDL